LWLLVKCGFHEFPLAWHSDDAAWLDFSDNEPIYTIDDSNVFIKFSDKFVYGSNENQNSKNLSSIDFIKKSKQIELVLYYKIAIKNN
jgi:hypothetical protein